MKTVTIEMDLNKPYELTKEQLAELEEAAKRPIIPDEDCPEITPDLIGKRFIRVDRHKRRSVV